MRSFLEKILLSIFSLVLTAGWLNAQFLRDAVVSPGMMVERLIVSDSSNFLLDRSRPLFSFMLGEKLIRSHMAASVRSGRVWSQTFTDFLDVSTTVGKDSTGIRAIMVFTNNGKDTVRISNIVPFGYDSSSVCITGKGPWDLARAWLFRPGLKPVRVILPDNAWEMGYSSFSIGKGMSVCAIARRTGTEGGKKQRYETLLPPGTSVTYTMYAELFTGGWQNGLRLMFRDRYLHDLEKFDNAMFERKDLQWMRESYLVILGMAWDREFYDRFSGKSNYADLIKKGIDQFGNIDVYGIWPTWPRLGLDQRNQWDLYRDLPGGLKQLKSFVQMSHQYGTRIFIAYNPWDNSTRKEDHLKGMADIIASTDADGVVLDTQGSSSMKIQAAADSVKKGVVMYSEGMAVTKDMPGIISGRVHNAIYLSPELNLNKLIKPDFSIFRVCDVGEAPIHRELAIAFFNGYGTELNMYRPGGRDDLYRDDMDYLAATTFILRQNNDAFTDLDWTPMVKTTADNVFVNRFSSGDKTIFTVLNMRPEGFAGKLFLAQSDSGRHWVSLWHHENLAPSKEKASLWIPATAEGWSKASSGTRMEGSVDCIAEFPVLIRAELSGDSLKLGPTGKFTLQLWKGNPSQKIRPRELKIRRDTTISIKDMFGIYEGKIVLQLIGNKRLKDERILLVDAGKPWLITRVKRTDRATELPADMVLVPGADFSFSVNAADEFIPYPSLSGKKVDVDSFLIDRFPVTNAQYYEFLISSGYSPSDTARFLRHWKTGVYRQGQEKYPVVNISYEDMAAYAKWAGKRLPTEAEWQLAAQGTDKRTWPWGNEFHGALCNNSFARSTPVDAFLKGQSPYGVVDMVGNVWQMTGDLYFNGSYYMGIIRGGSYFRPESSWWYIQGGPQPLDKTQIMLLVSPGYDRSNTVGFRCVKDVDPKAFRKR